MILTGWKRIQTSVEDANLRVLKKTENLITDIGLGKVIDIQSSTLHPKLQ
jgi:hypothetical protein